MQAIILAAGMGKRLAGLTKDNTKCMVRVNGIPLIDSALHHLSQLNLSRIVIVIGYQGDNLRRHIGQHHPKLPVHYIENPIYDKTNNIYSLSLARKELQEDDTLLIESDLIFDAGILQRIVAHPYPNLAVVDRYQPWMDGTVITKDAADNITSFIPKKDFNPAHTETYWKTVNIYKFSRDFATNMYLPFLETYMRVYGVNEYYEQVLRVLSFQDMTILRALALRSDERWYEIDTETDLHEAEQLFNEPSPLS